MESQSYGTKEHGWSSPLSLIFSQVPGVPTGVAQAREDGSPNVAESPPSRPPGHRHASPYTPSPATISGTRCHTPRFTSCSDQPGRLVMSEVH